MNPIYIRDDYFGSVLKSFLEATETITKIRRILEIKQSKQVDLAQIMTPTALDYIIPIQLEQKVCGEIKNLQTGMLFTFDFVLNTLSY